MKLDRRTIIGSALFVAGYITFTLVEELLFKKGSLTGELMQQMGLFALAVVGLLGVYEIILRYTGGRS